MTTQIEAYNALQVFGKLFKDSSSIQYFYIDKDAMENWYIVVVLNNADSLPISSLDRVDIKFLREKNETNSGTRT